MYIQDEDLFGGIKNSMKSNFIERYFRSGIYSIQYELYKDVKNYHVFGNLVVGKDESDIYILHKDKILKCPVSGNVLHVEKDNNKYYMYQSTENKLVVDEIDENGYIKRKLFTINIKYPSDIMHLTTSKNFFLIVDFEDNLLIIPKTSQINQEYSRMNKTYAYIVGNDIALDADLSNIQLFEYAKQLVVYLHSPKDNTIIRLHIDKNNYKLINYDIIHSLENCEDFDSRAMFYLDAYIHKNPEYDLKLENIIYLRNDGNYLIIGTQEEDHTKNIILELKNDIPEVLCELKISSEYNQCDFYIEKVLPVNFNNQRLMMAIQAQENGIKYIVFDHNGKHYTEIEETELLKQNIVSLICQKEINIDEDSKISLNENQDRFANEQVIDDEDDDLEFDFQQAEERIEQEEDEENDYEDDEEENHTTEDDDVAYEIQIKKQDDKVAQTINTSNIEYKDTNDINAIKVTI